MFIHGCLLSNTLFTLRFGRRENLDLERCCLFSFVRGKNGFSLSLKKNIKEKLVQGIKNIDHINHHMICNLRHGYTL